MNTHFPPTAGTTRCAFALLASIITATVFIAVATGLTGGHASAVLAQGQDVTAQAPLHGA